MAGVVRDWRIEFMEAHPRLFGVASQGYPACGDGWHDLLRRCCVRIEAALAEGDRFVVEDIKTKYGSLRFYWASRLSDAAKTLVEEAIELAEARSACTCETCGAPGRLYERGDWLTTACLEHARGEPVPVKAGRENLRIVGRLVGDRLRIVSCRRYDRDADVFVDVDPQSVGIEEE
jgi:hypothetical protein